MIRIGTINLNGEMWNLNRKLPRVSRKIIDQQKIKEQMTEVTKTQLGKILKSKKYDILAIQELVYFNPYFSEIKSKIESEQYELMFPENLGSHTHFTTAFIVKNELKMCLKKIDNFSENNRLIAKKIVTETGEITLCNVHMNTCGKDDGAVREDDVYKLLKESKLSKFIILGDFNAYTERQDTSKKSVISEDNIIYKLCREYKLVECGKDRDYTYKTSTFERKLDHIFISNDIKEAKEYEKINNDVNFMINEDEGFTDHSMLNIEIEYDIQK